MIRCNRIPIQRAILNGFRDVRSRDAIRAREIGDRSRDAQYSVIRARGQAQACKRRAQQALACFIQRAAAPDLARSHVRIASEPVAQARSLPVHCGEYSRTNGLAGFRLARIAQLPGRGNQDLDVDVDPVQ
jgi:hypothetical protein